MNTRTYIPNERRVLLTVRYDSVQMAEEDMLQALQEHMQTLDDRFVKPTGFAVADGALDWSLLPLDNPAPVARIRISGEVIQVDSVMPVMIIDDDTLQADTWLDSEIIGEEQLMPEGLTNRLSLPDGRLAARIKVLINREADIQPPLAHARRRYDAIDDNRWRLADEGDVAPATCGIVGCEILPWAKNITAHPGWLCEPHYRERNDLMATGQLSPIDPADGYMEYTGQDWPAAERLERYLARHCVRCGAEYADHYGERCAEGGTEFRCQEEFIGFDVQYVGLYRGEEDQVVFNRAGDRIQTEELPAAIEALAQEGDAYLYGQVVR